MLNSHQSHDCSCILYLAKLMFLTNNVSIVNILTSVRWTSKVPPSLFSLDNCKKGSDLPRKSYQKNTILIYSHLNWQSFKLIITTVFIDPERKLIASSKFTISCIIFSDTNNQFWHCRSFQYLKQVSHIR